VAFKYSLPGDCEDVRPRFNGETPMRSEVSDQKGFKARGCRASRQARAIPRPPVSGFWDDDAREERRPAARDRRRSL
jgi:hypothetical protein